MTQHEPNTQGDSWEETVRVFAEAICYGDLEPQTSNLLAYLRPLLSKERAEGERRLDTYFQFIKQTGKMHEFVKWEEARTLPADSTEGKKCERIGGCIGEGCLHTNEYKKLTTPDSTENV